MSKNSTEVLIELFIEENQKLKKYLQAQQELNEELKKIISNTSSFEVKSDRLEEVIAYWNDLFNKQKEQILQLQDREIKIKKAKDTKIFFLLIMIFILLLINLFI